MTQYFNGFSLKDEEALFCELLISNRYTIAGFSYGAQKAFEYVYHTKERIDRLILLSPAFFQTHKKSFIRTQLYYFETEQESYIKQFLKNVAYPSKIPLSSYLTRGNAKDLEKLLTYKWDKDKIQEVLERGTTIEVFLGEKDKIIDIKETFTFFSNLTTTYMMKDVGHLLQ